MGKLFITGDKHRNFKSLDRFFHQAQTTKDDVIIVLGDAGINYTLDIEDLRIKEHLAYHPITYLFIHGNHEERAKFVPGYKLIESPFGAGQVYWDERFPNQYFAEDGEHNILGHKTLVIGGAYSVDKEYRLARGARWFASEQPSEKLKSILLPQTAGQEYDLVLTHTCPISVTPQDMFLPMVDQQTVDRTTEFFLERIHDQITYDKWFCGHWHTDRMVDKVYFMYENVRDIR